MKAGIGDVTTFRFRYNVLANRVSSSLTIPVLNLVTSTETFAFTEDSSSEEGLLQAVDPNMNRIISLKSMRIVLPVPIIVKIGEELFVCLKQYEITLRDRHTL